MSHKLKLSQSIIILPVLVMLSACAGSSEFAGQEENAARKSAEVNTALGREYMERGQYEIALEKLKKAIRTDSKYAPAHTVLAVLYEQLGEMQLAGRHYRRAVDIAPQNGDTNNNYGVFLCKSGDFGNAQNYFLKAVEDPFYRTPAAALANAGACELEAGNVDTAEKFLRQSLEYDAEFSDALLTMASVNYRKGNNLGARAFLQRYEGAGPDTAESLELGVLIENRMNNSQVAQSYINRLLTTFPDSEQAKRQREALRK